MSSSANCFEGQSKGKLSSWSIRSPAVCNLTVGLGQAAAGLAHETRNPLGLIRGWTQRLVNAGLPTSDQQQRAEAVLEECDRVTARINDFLAFARPSEQELAAVDVNRLIHEMSMFGWAV